MQIKPRVIEDEISGLRIVIAEGEYLNRIHIDVIGEPMVKNRDFYFTKEGDFDGTGSCIGEEQKSACS